MKKFLIILCCASLLLPAAVSLVFADDVPYSFVFHNGYSQNHGQNCVLSVDRKLYGSSESYVFWQSFSVAEGFDATVTLDVGYDYRLSVRFGSSYVYPIPHVSVNGSVSSDPFVWENSSDVVLLYVSSSSDSSPTYRYISVPSADPFGELGVNDGVDSSISYTGQVLHFLATNTSTVVLIGLSVAMFAVLPFAICKIKQIIKGY